MPRSTPSELELEAEAALLEVEVALLAELAGEGRVVPGKRAPTTAEVRAGVRFADLERIVVDAAGRLDVIAARVRDNALDAIALDLGALYGRPAGDITSRLNALLDPLSDQRLAGLADLVGTAVDEAYAELVTLHELAGEEVLGEAARQRVPLGVRSPARLTPEVASTIRAQAERTVAQPVTRLLTVARDAAAAAPPDGDPVELAVDAAEAASRAGTEDLARQAAGVAHDAGRNATLRQVSGERQPAEVYSSELLDTNTCRPCADVDGRTYADLEEALLDYPGNGGYHLCQGGQRCRGSLVVVWNTEAGPTVDDRRGPEPTAPPPGQGPTPAPAAPAITSDTDLTTVDTPALEAALADAFTAGDYQAAETLSNELDRRAPLDEADAPQLDGPIADVDGWEAERDAVDAYLAGRTPGITTGARPPRGRRIDRVRADYDEWTYGEWLAAEDATRGNLIRREVLEEFTRRYGNTEALFTGPARVAGHYASDELLEFWRGRQRLTFYEFAEQAGIRDAKTRARARTAREARDADLFRNAGRTGVARRRPPASKPRRPLTAGEKLDRERRRAERARKLTGD